MVNLGIRALKGIRVGIIDIFGKKKGIPINGTVKDFTHGEMTSSVLTALTKDLDVNITKIPVNVREGTGNSLFDLKSLLKQLKRINKEGKDFDYLNISSVYTIPYDIANLSMGGKELADLSVRNEILSKLRNGLAPKQAIHIIDELERISKGGTKIYISAGNKPKEFNVFSLAEGVHTIGGKDGLTQVPIQRFTANPLVENFQNLPVYVTKQKAFLADPTKTVVNLNGLIPIESNLAKLSKRELTKKIANKNDYIKLQTYVDELYKSGKYKFDIDFLRFKFVSSLEKPELCEKIPGLKNLRGKIFDLNKFMQIFDGKFDQEVLKYTFPQGTHCDLSFRQFFDMKSKSKHVISMKKNNQNA